MQTTRCGYLDTAAGVGLLPCPPFQRLHIEAGCVGVKRASGSIDTLDRTHTTSSAAMHLQRRGGISLWQAVTLRPLNGIKAYGPNAAPLRQLLDSHHPAPLIFHWPPTMQLIYKDLGVDDEAGGDMTEAEAMLHSRITD